MTSQLDDIKLEVQAWHRRYNEAWENRDANTIATLTDPELHGTMVMMDGQEHWQVSYDGDIDGTRNFFEYVAINGSRNEFEIYDIAFRSPDEAIVVTRKKINITGGGNPRTTIQFALETLKRGHDREWRLVRYWAEKAHVTAS